MWEFEKILQYRHPMQDQTLQRLRVRLMEKRKTVTVSISSSDNLTSELICSKWNCPTSHWPTTDWLAVRYTIFSCSLKNETHRACMCETREFCALTPNSCDGHVTMGVCDSKFSQKKTRSETAYTWARDRWQLERAKLAGHEGFTRAPYREYSLIMNWTELITN